MPLELTCRQCGKVYTPSKADVLSGRYRLCPSCRDEPPPATSMRPIDAPAAACGTLQNLTFLRGYDA